MCEAKYFANNRMTVILGVRKQRTNNLRNRDKNIAGRCRNDASILR